MISIRASEEDAACTGLASYHIDTGLKIGRILWNERYATDGSLGLGLDVLFGFGGAIPMAEQEAALLDLLLELLPGIDTTNEAIAHLASLLEDVVLDLIEELDNVIDDAFLWEHLLLERVATNEFKGAILKVACTESDAYGDVR